MGQCQMGMLQRPLLRWLRFPLVKYSKESILEEVAELSWGDFKPLLADAIVAHLEPIQKKYASIREDPTFLEGVLRDGADSANEVADKTLGAARVAMGFVPRPR